MITSNMNNASNVIMLQNVNPVSFVYRLSALLFDLVNRTNKNTVYHATYKRKTSCLLPQLGIIALAFSYTSTFLTRIVSPYSYFNPITTNPI